MAAVSGEGGGAALRVDRLLLTQEGGHGFEHHAEVDVLAVADAALDAATVVGHGGNGGGVGGRRDEGVVLLAAALVDAAEAGTVVEALGGIDAQHRLGERGMELGELRLADAWGTAADDAGDDAADGVAVGFHLGDECFHLAGLLRVGTAHCVLLGHCEVVVAVVVVESDRSHLRGVGHHADAHLAEGQLGHGSADDAAQRDACRRASASAVVARTIFIKIGVVGMGGTEERAQVLIVLRVLILVSDDEADGGAGRAPFEDAAEQLYVVGLGALGGQRALAGAAAVELALYEVEVDLDACGHAVDDAADGRPVAFAKGGQCEQMSERVAHTSLVLSSQLSVLLSGNARSRPRGRGRGDGRSRPRSLRSHSRSLRRSCG